MIRRRSARSCSWRRGWVSCGRRAATNARAFAHRGAFSTTQRICSSTHALPTIRRGARRSRSRIPWAASPIRISVTRVAIHSRPSTRGGENAAFPAFGVYVNTPLNMEPTQLQQWNVERAAAVRRLDGIGQLSREPIDPPVAGDRAESGGVRSRRDDRQHQPAPRPLPEEPDARAVLRHDWSRRRQRPRQLQRSPDVAAAPLEERLQRARELDDFQVHERSGDDGDHGADDRQPGRSRPRLLRTARRIDATSPASRRS